MAVNSDSGGWLLLLLIGGGMYLALNGTGDCEKYASEFSCSYVENEAEYEVWYWRNIERDNGADEAYIGRAQGIKMCEDNARAFAASIGEPWNYRAYVCVLLKDGQRVEKHRNLG
jgi:hypothetical protein